MPLPKLPSFAGKDYVSRCKICRRYLGDPGTTVYRVDHVQKIGERVTVSIDGTTKEANVKLFNHLCHLCVEQLGFNTIFHRSTEAWAKNYILTLVHDNAPRYPDNLRFHFDHFASPDILEGRQIVSDEEAPPSDHESNNESIHSKEPEEAENKVETEGKGEPGDVEYNPIRSNESRDSREVYEDKVEETPEREQQEPDDNLMISQGSLKGDLEFNPDEPEKADDEKMQLKVETEETPEGEPQESSDQSMKSQESLEGDVELNLVCFDEPEVADKGKIETEEISEGEPQKPDDQLIRSQESLNIESNLIQSGSTEMLGTYRQSNLINSDSDEDSYKSAKSDPIINDEKNNDGSIVFEGEHRSSDDEDHFKCSICDATFNTNDKLVSHKEIDHYLSSEFGKL